MIVDVRRSSCREMRNCYYHGHIAMYIVVTTTITPPPIDERVVGIESHTTWMYTFVPM